MHVGAASADADAPCRRGDLRRARALAPLGLGALLVALAAGLALSSARADARAETMQVAPFGRLDREVIRAVVLARMDEVRACYERQLATQPDLTGRVLVSFTIAPDGHVSGASVESSTLAPRGEPATAVEVCLVGVVLSYGFPPPEGGGPVQVNYPFVLAPPAPAEGAERRGASR